MDSKHGVGRVAGVLGVYREMGCGIIGLQKNRRSFQSGLQGGCVVYCSSEPGGAGGGKKCQGRVGLAAPQEYLPCRSTIAGVISDRLLKGTLQMCGRPRAVTFVVRY